MAPVPAPVGRPRWATVEQTAFLDGRLRKLETEGAGDTLVVYYNRVSRDFLGTWPVVSGPLFTLSSTAPKVESTGEQINPETNHNHNSF